MKKCVDCNHFMSAPVPKCRRAITRGKIDEDDYRTCNVERWFHILWWRHCGRNGRFWGASYGTEETMCDNNINKELLEDPEAEAMAHAFLYLDGAEERCRERYMFHLTHRYFPEGMFQPKQHEINFDDLNIKRDI